MFVAGYQRRPLPLQQLVLTETSVVQKVSIKVTSHSMCQMLFFSLDAGPQSLPPLVCRLVDIGLFKVSPRLPSVAASAEPSHVVASCTRISACCSPKSYRLVHRVKVRTVRRSDAFWRKNSAVECARSAGALCATAWFYGNQAGGSRPVWNFSPTISRKINNNEKALRGDANTARWL